MNQNLKIPFTNERLLISIQKKSLSSAKQANESTMILQKNCSSLNQQYETTDTQTKNMLSQTYNSLLNYSNSTCNLEENNTPHFSRLKEDENSFQMEQNHNNQELLQELLFDSSVNNQNKFERKSNQPLEPIQMFKIHQNNTDVHDDQSNEITDYSNELKALKSTIVEIQRFAQLEITRLKKQLEYQKKMRKQEKQKGLCQKIGMSTVQIGINTEHDFRDDQINILKESVLQHINLNRQLLRKQIKNNSLIKPNFEQLMNKVKI